MDKDDYSVALSARHSWEVDDRFHEYILIAVIETDSALTGTSLNEAVTAEREACAKACAEYDDDGGAGESWALRFANVIRDRSIQNKDMP